MKQLNLNIENRTETGSGPCGRIRKMGKIPAVIYGEDGLQNISVVESELRKLMRELHGTSALIELTDTEGAKTLTVLKDLSRHSVTDLFLHVDFHQISLGKPMNVEVGVVIIGESTGVKNENGVLEQHAHEVDIRCLPKNLPEIIEVDVTDLHAGDAIHISSLPALEGVEYLGDPEIVVVACTSELAEEPEEEAEVAAEEPAAAPTS